jgi:uncharacterized membrane protein (UPF0127 family)
MQFSFYKGKTKLLLEVKKCGFLQSAAGLMFKKRETAGALLFEFSSSEKRAIHSLFVFFPFLAIWLNDKNKIIEISRVMPWRLSICPKKPFKKLIEVPINARYSKIMKLLVGD